MNGLVCLEIKMDHLYAVIPNLYEFLFSVEHKRDVNVSIQCCLGSVTLRPNICVL